MKLASRVGRLTLSSAASHWAAAGVGEGAQTPRIAVYPVIV